MVGESVFTSSPLFPAAISDYELPNCLTSEDDMLRLRQGDLYDMGEAEFTIEHVRARDAWIGAYGKRVYIYTVDLSGYVLAETWLLERLTAIDAESRRRRRSA